MPDRIFISYCHKDGDFADILAAKLKQNGFEHWLDITELKGGDEWREEIDRSIRDSSALILVMTPESRDSIEVTCEWVFALGAGLKVVPIMLHETQLHPRLNEIHHYDFTNRGARPWDKLIDDLKKLCEKKHRKECDAYDEARQVGSIELPTNSIENAMRSLYNDDPNERKKAIDLLIQNQIISKDALLSALKRHPSNDVRYWIARKFGDSGYRDGIPELIEALEDPDNSVRAIAAWSLGILGDGVAATGLKRALRDPDSSVRGYAAGAIGLIGDKDAIPELTEALKDTDNFVREQAAQALKTLGVMSDADGQI